MMIRVRAVKQQQQQPPLQLVAVTHHVDVQVVFVDGVEDSDRVYHVSVVVHRMDHPTKKEATTTHHHQTI